jgi:type IV pilus assembly protein PilX
MKSLPNRIVHRCGHATRQRGVVLFFALIALVVMSLAAVALIRSVDTSTMIAGNLAFKQSAVASGDSGVEAAISALNAMQAGDTLLVLSDPTDVFNQDDAANGYYTNADDIALNLFDPATWGSGSSVDVGTDASGNRVRYIIQRMCRDPNVILSTTNCLFSAPTLDTSGQSTPLLSTVCPATNPGCPKVGQSPEYRITSRTDGPANTVSYVQVFVF